MLRLWGRTSSINVRKVLWTCAELSLPHELTPWGQGDLALDSAAFRTLNPNGLVPVIREGDFVLWESNAICRYLAAREGATTLLPAEPHRRAKVEQWMDWQATELNNAWRSAFMGLVRRSPAHADPSAIEASIRAWNRHMAVLDDALHASGAFVCGEALTLADIVLGLSTHRWYSTPFEKPDLPAVARYYDTLSQRPGFRAHGRNGLP